MPLFRKGLGPHALPTAMSGVKLGEQLLYVGSGRPGLFAVLASKVGLTGRACAIVNGQPEAEAMQRAAAREGVLVEIAVGATGAFPYQAGTFDVAVIDGSDGTFGSMDASDRQRILRESAQALRPGARVLLIEGAPGPLKALLGAKPLDPSYRSAGGPKAVLEGAGFRPVRVLAEREQLRFTEGIKPAVSAS